MREFLLSLGILLGIVAPQADPALATRVFRASGQLCVTVEVRDAVGADARNLVRAGNTLELVLAVTGPLADQHGEFKHQLAYDPISQRFSVSMGETGLVHQTGNEAAALDIFGRFFALPLAPAAELALPARIELRAHLNNLSDPAFATAVLWNYKQPALDLRFDRISDYTPAAGMP